MPEKLLPKQVAFTRCLGQLIAYAYSRGYGFTMAEGYIGDSINKPSEDTPHLRHGNHFKRLAQDLNLIVDGDWVKDGGDPRWTELGHIWESLDPRARWGGRFRDANHFSFEHDGMA